MRPAPKPGKDGKLAATWLPQAGGLSRAEMRKAIPVNQAAKDQRRRSGKDQD
jgi:hypothetical protein